MEAKRLSEADILAILRGADELIAEGGRSLLAKNFKRIAGEKSIGAGIG